MDVRAKIVDQVLEALPELDSELCDKVERVLLVSLQDYEVQERCTDVVPHDDSSLGLVRKFIATKKLEGKSECTLRRYQPELERLILFLNKKLFEVSPYDLRRYLGSRTDNNPALFVGLKDPHRRLTKEGIEYIVKDLGKRAGVDNVHPHRFRRTLATDLVRKGVPIQDVAQILGHSDLRTTQVYVALDQSTVKYHYNQSVA